MKYIFIVILFLSLFIVPVVYAHDGFSDSPPDQWWMIAGNNSFSRFAIAHGPANISNATVISKVFSESSISGGPLIINDSLYLMSVNFGSGRAYRINASNVSQIFENSSGTYTLNGGSPTYHNLSLFFHTGSGTLTEINLSNLSQTIKSVSIADGIYYAAPSVYNFSVYIGDGNAAPRYKQFNLSNISQTLTSWSASGRIYESAPILNNYAYVSESGQLGQLNMSNISQNLNSFGCVANSVAYIYPASKDYVYKTCTVNSVNMLQQLNATNITRVIANYSNGTGGYALGNGYIYFGLGTKVYQLNATNVSQHIANFTTYTSMNTLNFPIVNHDYLYISAGVVMYQLDARNVSRLIGNYSAATTISGPPTLSRGYIYFGAGTRLYQIGSENAYSGVDSTPPSVTLSSPGTYYANDTSDPFSLGFNCTVTDSVSLANVSLYLTNPDNSSFAFNQTATLSGSSGTGNWTIPLRNGNYTWNCFAYDSANNSAWASTNGTIILNFTDWDGDNVTDSQDRLMGNLSTPYTSGISALNITVGGSAVNGTFSGEKVLMFYDGNDRMLNFSFNFSAATLYLARIGITTSETTLIANLSGQLQSGYNKTIYIDDETFGTLCVKDDEIALIEEVTTGCTGSNETDISSCIGSSTTVTFGNITCVDEGSVLAIGGLRYSAVRGTAAAGGSSIDEEDESNGGASGYIHEIGTRHQDLTLRFIVPAGVSLKREISNSKETGIKEFEIKSKNWLSGRVTVKPFKEPPANCEIENSEDYAFYKALEFNHDFSNNDVDTTRVRLGIDKEWIVEKKVSEIEVVRCYPDYERIRSSYVEETSDEGIYDMYSTGFSTYAILGKVVSEDLQILSASPIKERSFVWLWIIVIAGALGGFIVFLRSRRATFHEDLHVKNKWFDFEWKVSFKLNRPPHKRFFGP